MADINIERKSGMPWLWGLLGLIALAFVAWLLLADRGDPLATDTVVDEPAAVMIPDPIETDAAGTAALPAVQEFLNTCAERAPGDMGLDHEYTSSCIDSLVRSIETTLAQPTLTQVNAQEELQAARQASDRLSASQEDAEHSTMTQEAFTSVAALFDRLQNERFPALDNQVSRLEAAAREVSPSQPLLDQRTAVQDFFQQSGSILRGMADQR